MNTGARIRKIRQALNKTQTEFGTTLAVTQTYLAAIERGHREVTEKILKLVVLQYNVNENWLRTGEGEMFSTGPGASVSRLVEDYGLDSLETLALTAYLNLAQEDRAVIMKYLQGIIDKTKKNEPVKPHVLFPDTMKSLRNTKRQYLLLSEQPASAGTGIYLGPESFTRMEVEGIEIPAHVVFAVPVSGDSMSPTYKDGDILLVASEPVEVGQIGVFTMDGEGYVKKRGVDALESLNHTYEAIPMNESIRCNGKVVGVIRKPE